MTSLTVVLPAYNEEENLETLVCRWQEFRETLASKYALELQIVAVNDGSKDQTQVIAQRLEGEYENFTLVDHPYNQGLGAAVRTGVSYFLEQRPQSDFLCIMDCDNTQDPCYIMAMLDQMKEQKASVVIASRYQQGAEVKGVSGMRLLMSGGARFVFTMLLPVPKVRDYTCGYRLYSREGLVRANDRFGKELIQENGFTCMVELLYKLYLSGSTFAEIPFSLRYDYKQGASKMSVLKTAKNSVILARKLKKRDD